MSEKNAALVGIEAKINSTKNPKEVVALNAVKNALMVKIAKEQNEKEQTQQDKFLQKQQEKILQLELDSESIEVEELKTVYENLGFKSEIVEKNGKPSIKIELPKVSQNNSPSTSPASPKLETVFGFGHSTSHSHVAG